MWLSDILKKLDTLLSVRGGQIQSPPECGKMQVFCSQQTAGREKKNLPSPSLSLLHPAAREMANSKAVRMALTVMKFPICSVLACLGHLHIIVSENYLLESKPRISSFHPNCRSYRDITETGLSDFPRLSVYVTTTIILNGQ